MQADIEPATHPGPGQSLGVGFCLNLPWCSSAAFNLCKELFRCYAPLERQLYYQEDPFNSQHRYLAAVQHRRRQQQEKGNGEDVRRQEERAAAPVTRADVVCTCLCILKTEGIGLR